MGTDLPNPMDTTGFAAGGDDPKLGRPTLASNVGLFNALLDALGQAARRDIGDGLESLGQPSGTPDRLRVALLSSSGLSRTASGIGLDWATQAQAEGGSNSDRPMNPLRTRQLGDARYLQLSGGELTGDFAISGNNGLTVGHTGITSTSSVKRMGVKHPDNSGPTGGGFQMAIGDDGLAFLVNRENEALVLRTNNNANTDVILDPSGRFTVSGDLEVGGDIIGGGGVERFIFTSSGTLNLSGYQPDDMVFAQVWAGGGSGSLRQSSNGRASGGGGGGYTEAWFRVGDLPSSVSITRGAGGAGIAAGGQSNGNGGGNSTFHATGTLMARGGAGGTQGINEGANAGGRGGGPRASQFDRVAQLGTASTDVDLPGGGNIWAGGPGGNANNPDTSGGHAGGHAVWGGGGGGGSSRLDNTHAGSGGVSQHAGAGGGGSTSQGVAAGAGGIPAGGGGAMTHSDAGSGAGGRGEIRVTIFKS